MQSSDAVAAATSDDHAELPAVISREDLYALVWTEPMSRLSRRFGLSDVGLAKACTRMMIPVPGRGYWAKKDVGRAPRPTRLPTLPASAGVGGRELRVRRREAPSAKEASREESAAIQVVVPEILSEPHPLVAKTVKAFRGGKSQHDGYFMAKTPDCLAVHTTMGSIDRALRIYDAVIKAIEECGYVVEVQKYKRENYSDPQYRTVVLIDNESVEIVISETTRRIERPRQGSSDPHPKYEFVPSGQLSLVIQNATRSRWSDGAKRALESQLGRFIQGIAVAAVELKESRRRREEFEREQIEAQRRQREESERRRTEAARVRALNAVIDRMHSARWIREYLTQLKENLSTFPEADTPDMQDWLTWVEGYAGRIDSMRSPATVPKDPNPYG